MHTGRTNFWGWRRHWLSLLERVIQMVISAKIILLIGLGYAE